MRGPLLRTRKRRITTCRTVSLCLVAILSACSYWRIWSYGDLFLYLCLRRHSPVAPRPLARAIRPGGQIDRVIAMFRPNFIDSLGPFLRIDYYPTGDLPPGAISLEGTSLTAKDGRLISAGSYGCTFQRIYFDVSTADENALYVRLVQESINARTEVTPQGLSSCCRGPTAPCRGDPRWI